jgi:chromosome segregation ATPase
MTITLTREEAQQVLDALQAALSDDQPYIVRCKQTVETLRARLTQPENEFNPDWDAMAVMVEEQQRMAKQIEELDIALAEQDAKYLDAVEILDDEGWTWDGDQWQRPATRLEKMREWQGLTDDEIYDSYSEPCSDSEMVAFARKIEAKLKEKNA